MTGGGLPVSLGMFPFPVAPGFLSDKPARRRRIVSMSRSSLHPRLSHGLDGGRRLANFVSSPTHGSSQATGNTAMRRDSVHARLQDRITNLDFVTRSGLESPSRLRSDRRLSPSRAALAALAAPVMAAVLAADRKSTRLNSSHVKISYGVFCLKKKM